jgi:transposase
MLYLGIDQHKRQLAVNLRSEDGSVILKRQVSTQWEKVRAFFSDLAEKARSEGGFLAILEVCGMNPWLLDMLNEFGCREIVVIQPTECDKQKTDRRDAGDLAHLLWVHRQQFLDGKHPLGLRRIQPPTPLDADDRQLTALRARLTRRRTAAINGIHKILAKHNLEQACPTKKFQTKKVHTWLTTDSNTASLKQPPEQLRAIAIRRASRSSTCATGRCLCFVKSLFLPAA